MLVALGKSIRSYRKMANLSQERLALATGIDRAYLGSIERGDQNIGVMHLFTIARALDISVSELVMEARL